jgi:hypothetical protein
MKLGIDLLHVIGSVVPRTEFHAFNRSGIMCSGNTPNKVIN